MCVREREKRCVCVYGGGGRDGQGKPELLLKRTYVLKQSKGYRTILRVLLLLFSKKFFQQSREFSGAVGTTFLTSVHIQLPGRINSNDLVSISPVSGEEHSSSLLQACCVWRPSSFLLHGSFLDWRHRFWHECIQEAKDIQ